MNQRLYVQRPSVLTPLLQFERSSPRAEGGESHSRTSQPSHQKHHRSNIMLTVYETISYGNEYFRCFMVSFSAGEERHSLAWSDVDSSSLPTVYSLKVLLVSSESRFISGAADILNAV